MNWSVTRIPDLRFGSEGYGTQQTGTTRKLPEYQKSEAYNISTPIASDSTPDEAGLQRNISTPIASKFDKRMDYFGFLGHEEVSCLAFLFVVANIC